MCQFRKIQQFLIEKMARYLIFGHICPIFGNKLRLNIFSQHFEHYHLLDIDTLTIVSSYLTHFCFKNWASSIFSTIYTLTSCKRPRVPGVLLNPFSISFAKKGHNFPSFPASIQTGIQTLFSEPQKKQRVEVEVEERLLHQIQVKLQALS